MYKLKDDKESFRAGSGPFDGLIFEKGTLYPDRPENERRRFVTVGTERSGAAKRKKAAKPGKKKKENTGAARTKKVIKPTSSKGEGNEISKQSGDA